MKLNKNEAMLINGAEECRRRAMVGLDQGDADPEAVVQFLAAAAEGYKQASAELARRLDPRTA